MPLNFFRKLVKLVQWIDSQTRQNTQVLIKNVLMRVEREKGCLVERILMRRQTLAMLERTREKTPMTGLTELFSAICIYCILMHLLYFNTFTVFYLIKQCFKPWLYVYLVSCNF